MDTESIRIIYDAIVDGKKHQIRQDYKSLLDPYSHLDYPLSNVGILPRVTRKFLGNWINLPNLIANLNRLPLVKELFCDFQLNNFEKKRLIKDALSIIGTESYTAEWTRVAANMQLNDVIEVSTGITVDANNLLAKTLEQKIVDFFSCKRDRMFKIFDVGAGTGNTILPVISLMNDLVRGEKIPSDFYKKVQIFLLDVSSDALEMTYSRLAGKLPYFGIFDGSCPIMRIVPIKSNFINLPKNETLKKHGGSMDLIVSGAAICHQTDLQPFIYQMYSLLRKGGVMSVWDWYNGPSFAAPRLRMSKDAERKIVFNIKNKGEEQVMSFLDDEMRSNKENDLFYLLMESASEVNVIYEILETDSISVISNFRTLLGFLGYLPAGRGVLTEGFLINGLEAEDCLLDMYNKRISLEKGFNFFDDFLGLLCGKTPEFQSAYYMLEGYGDDYAKIMNKVGFVNAVDHTFMGVYKKYKSYVGRSMTDLMPARQIRYTYGEK